MFQYNFLDIYGGSTKNCHSQKEDYEEGNYKKIRVEKVDQYSFRFGIKEFCGNHAILIDKMCLHINENFNSSQILIDDKSSTADTDIQITPEEACAKIKIPQS